MTAPVAQAQFTASRPDCHLTTAAMWRGAAIDIFAALEAMALDWLTTLGEKDSKAKSADFVAWHRFNRLASLVAERRYAPHNRSIQSLLTELEGEHDLRTALAHGRMSATTAGMALTWTGRDKGAWRRRTLTMTWLQAVETLYKLDKLQRDLASQLGQIKRHCLSKKAQNAA